MFSTLTRVLVMFCCNSRKKKPSTMNTGRELSTELGYQKSASMITTEQVSCYLTNHPNFLEQYIMDNVEMEQIERWIIRKSKKGRKPSDFEKAARKTSLSRWKFCVHADKRKMLQSLTRKLQIKPSKDYVLWELANCISSAVNADGFRLFIVDKGDPNVLLLYPGEEHTQSSSAPHLQRMKKDISIALYVARTQQPVRLSRGKPDSRFSSEIMNENHAAHIQCQPIVESDGQLPAILELWRRESGGPFHEEDEEIASSYLVWGGIGLHYAQLYLNMNQQKTLNDFLLAVVKSIFQNMVSIDSLVIKIMNFAQKLVDADRASLFLVDSKNAELYATIFDVGVDAVDNSDEISFDSCVSESEELKLYTSREIRFPLGTGIAGHVASTGEILNIKDAYADPRFNRAVDQLTGYTTHTILCMPIFIRGSIIGVVQMVNKHKGNFTKNDEEAFETFAVYSGLALHHAKLYDKIRKSEQKYKVALDVLSYHNTCTEEEYRTTLAKGIPKEIAGIDDYYFNPFELKDFDKARHAMYMFNDLFGCNGFDQNCLLRFILTVRKNYRRVPYHNWTHGFSVANSMFCILKHSRGAFERNESLALFIGALCHDLDHRGKNNKFMLDTESPLAAIYSTSTMEHHHFNQTVTILQQEGHNIFSRLTNKDYKQILGLLKHCILATDLAAFFPNKSKLASIVKASEFSWNNLEHRRLLQAIAMTGSDLSASAKPWKIQKETVKVIFEEFYDQGDAERAAGRNPIPMMDRNRPEEQPASQVGFLTGICIPCYDLLYTLIPETKALLEMCKQNLEKWKKIDMEFAKQ
ncbi:probable 3',5'-cyclic phosphodiesterase pde-5 isoform X2 [Leptinotarsa decemlineata]|uniref:probable 3',5'-cyclic phosphodiesterase pde-5 isoform X2 n=1 Tax=Leptinotarsa decemlineata TaxID=7539 RepID=UPI003D304E99